MRKCFAPGVAVTLGVMLLTPAASFAYGDCRKFDVSPGQQDRLIAAAKVVTGERLDFRTLYACRANKIDYVWIDSRRIDQPDGSARWRSLDCGGKGTWECTLVGDHRSVDVSVAGYPRRTVEIPLDMPVEEARTRVTQVYSLVGTLSVEHFDPGPYRDRFAPGKIDEINRQVRRSDADLVLSKEGADRYSFQVNSYILSLIHVAADDSLQIKRVSETEELE